MMKQQVSFSVKRNQVLIPLLVMALMINGEYMIAAKTERLPQLSFLSRNNANIQQYGNRDAKPHPRGRNLRQIGTTSTKTNVYLKLTLETLGTMNNYIVDGLISTERAKY